MEEVACHCTLLQHIVFFSSVQENRSDSTSSETLYVEDGMLQELVSVYLF